MAIPREWRPPVILAAAVLRSRNEIRFLDHVESEGRLDEWAAYLWSRSR
jgi:hypothetical protein